ncbi:hypothetical protein AB8A05_29625 [Tardiphaga sp. 538_B7_N1_4]|uniref:hypothetical protein n=1 Tax=Tardiphaga sp. 538_B7_N1_4 TaxID=3240778 RepID=UPI003F1E4A20
MTVLLEGVKPTGEQVLMCRHAVEVERTVTYRRKVWVEVEETDERLKDAKRYPGDLLKDEAGDAAVEKARPLTGWEKSDVAYGNASVAEVQVGLTIST